MYKVYDALDRYTCINILCGYGLGPQALILLRRYWYILTMVAQVRGFCGPPFKGYLG